MLFFANGSGRATTFSRERAWRQQQRQKCRNNKHRTAGSTSIQHYIAPFMIHRKKNTLQDP